MAELQTLPRRLGPKASRWLAALALISAVVMFGNIFYELSIRQWDMACYHAAAQMVSEGKNPYDFEALAAYESEPDYPYHYPIWVADVLRPLGALSFKPSALIVWGVLKLLALAALAVLLRRYVTPTLDWGSYLCLLILGVQGAVLVDIRSGNIEIFQNLVLWLGVVLALKSRPLWGSLLIALAAGAKFFPILLVAPLALTGSLIPAILGFVCFAGLILLPFLPRADWLSAFFSSPPSLWGNEPGSGGGPFDLTLTSLVGYFEDSPGGSIPLVAVWMATAGLAFVLGFVAWKKHRGNLLILVEAAALLAAASMPRMIVYSGMIMMVAILMRGERKGYSMPVLLLLTLPGLSQLPEIPSIPVPIPWNLAACWFLYLLTREEPVPAHHAPSGS